MLGQQFSYQDGLPFDIVFDMPNTKAAGDVSEAAVLAEFVRLDFPVCVPFGDNQRYDLVVGVGGRFLRVQCKTAWLDRARSGGAACLRFRACSGGRQERRAYRGEADLFGEAVV